MERRIDFLRERQMLCGICRYQWMVDLDWIDRWDQAKETCPGCGTTCEFEDSPQVTIDPGDVALGDGQVAHLSWYHTSTQPDWPTSGFDPAAELTPEARMRMGGDKRVAQWAARQRGKALHIGTYEAAIHNMLRRIRNQADQGRQFYLYRVHLKSSVVVRKGWLIDPSDSMGDLALAEVCPPGIDVARYLNYHEDPGGISLALGREAIACVQQVAIPLPGASNDEWVRDAVAALDGASDILEPAPGKLSRFMPPSSPRAVLGRELGGTLANRLPINLRGKFTSAVTFAEGEDPERWAHWTSNLCGLIEDPGRALVALDEVELRSV